MLGEVKDKLIIGDTLDVLSRLPAKSVDLVCTDPPYNIGKDFGATFDKKDRIEQDRFTDKWLKECRRILKNTGSIYIFMGTKYIARLYLKLEELGFLFNSWITWHYTQGIGKKRGFSPRHEDVLYFTKSKNFTFNLDDIRIPQKYHRRINNMKGANPGDVWEFSHVHFHMDVREEHPTQKPEGIIERIIRTSSNEGDMVLDPFLGSGTTVRVAKIMNRHYIGIDINPDYVAIARDRLTKEFKGFDTVDVRAKRIPLDLPELEDASPYLFSANKR